MKEEEASVQKDRDRLCRYLGWKNQKVEKQMKEGNTKKQNRQEKKGPLLYLALVYENTL